MNFLMIIVEEKHHKFYLPSCHSFYDGQNLFFPTNIDLSNLQDLLRHMSVCLVRHSRGYFATSFTHKKKMNSPPVTHTKKPEGVTLHLWVNIEQNNQGSFHTFVLTFF